MRSLALTFHVDAALVEAFAALSGDRNALHLDAAFARRSRYRERVAHGMVATAHLARLGALFPEHAVRFRALEGRFAAPVPLGTTLRLEVELAAPEAGDAPGGEVGGERAFEAVWRGADGGSVLQVSGRLALLPRPALGAGGDAGGDACLLAAPTVELERGAAALEGAAEVLELSVTGAALQALGRLTGLPPDVPVCPNLAATLALSTLVGMRLPGRHATFTSFALTFDRDVGPGLPVRLEGLVRKVSAASETLIAGVRLTQQAGSIAAGEVRALVNPPPRRMLGAAEIEARHTGLGLAGKVVVVIGASRGIGETAAKLFAMHGTAVVVHYFRGRADAEAIVADIEAAGGRALAFGCDIRDEAAVEVFFAAAAEAMGGIDVLVNNAVVDVNSAPLEGLGWVDLDRELAVSLKGLHACCRAAIPLMKGRGGGRIINVSTVYTGQPVKGQGKYITAKAAVEGYTKSLAIELARDNIQVNLVVPAMTETDLLAAIPSDYIRRAGNARAMQRNLQPIEVAQAMVYLASSWTAGMSGQKVVLNLGEPPFA